MKLDVPLLKLPRQYCAKTLAAEVTDLPPEAWQPHPGRIVGNDAVPLITPGGDITNSFSGPMAPTRYLDNCPYIKEILTDIGAVWGRSRLMGLAPSYDVPEHVDVGYYWRTHLRLHIPIITNPGVRFTCDGTTVHMAAGECWAFDSFCLHKVQNLGSEKRIHLVLDTVGGEKLWDMMLSARHQSEKQLDIHLVAPGVTASSEIAYEHINLPETMSAWEVRCHIDFLLRQAPDVPQLDGVRSCLDRFAVGWSALWAQHGNSPDHCDSYRSLIENAKLDLRRHGADKMLLKNAVSIGRMLEELIFLVAVPNLTADGT